LFCNNCGYQVRDDAKFCESCGKLVIWPEKPRLSSPQWAAELRGKTAARRERNIWQWKTIGKGFGIAGLGVLGFVLLLLIVGSIHRVTTPAEQLQREDAERSAKRALAKKQEDDKRASSSSSSTESPPVAPAAVDSLEPPAKSPTPEDRIVAAKLLDQLFLHAGVESTTLATGPAHTTLYIKDILAGRVRAQAMQENIPWDKLRGLGFRRVIYTNGLKDVDCSGENCVATGLNVTFTWRIDQLK
jgi:hypothetical protein